MYYNSTDTFYVGIFLNAEGSKEGSSYTQGCHILVFVLKLVTLHLTF